MKQLLLIISMFISLATFAQDEIYIPKIGGPEYKHQIRKLGMSLNQFLDDARKGGYYDDLQNGSYNADTEKEFILMRGTTKLHFFFENDTCTWFAYMVEDPRYYRKKFNKDFSFDKKEENKKGTSEWWNGKDLKVELYTLKPLHVTDGPEYQLNFYRN